MVLLGLENTDYKWYPNEETQKQWIRFYLRESAHLSGECGGWWYVFSEMGG